MRTTDDADETLTPRQHHQRALREKRERRAAEAEATAPEAGPCAPTCIRCALAAAERNQRIAPRVARRDFDVFDRTTWGANAPRGGM